MTVKMRSPLVANALPLVVLIKTATLPKIALAEVHWHPSVLTVQACKHVVALLTRVNPVANSKYVVPVLPAACTFPYACLSIGHLGLTANQAHISVRPALSLLHLPAY